MMTFKNFLVEVVADIENLDDPNVRSQVMRRMRVDNPDQQARMDDRIDRQLTRDRRAAVQQEQDPRKKQLLRKKNALMQQLDRINQQIDAAGEGQGEM
jgi:hypothetical protein